MSLYQDDIAKIEVICRRIVKEAIEIAMKSIDQKINPAPRAVADKTAPADESAPAKPKKESRK